MNTVAGRSAGTVETHALPNPETASQRSSRRDRVGLRSFDRKAMAPSALRNKDRSQDGEGAE